MYLTGTNFSVSAAVGFVSLFGVAIMEGLLLISYFNALRAQGLPVQEAIIQGSLKRVRPVMITAMTAILGLLPAAVSTKIGAQTAQPLAIVVVGGMTVTLLPGPLPDAGAVQLLRPPRAAGRRRRDGPLSAAGASLSEVVSTSIATLTQGAIKAMLLAKVKQIVLAVATLRVITTGVGGLAQGPSQVAAAGAQTSQKSTVAVAQPPSTITMKPLVLYGSTALDPRRLARVRARFAPARVVELARVWDFPQKDGRPVLRELRVGDHVKKGDLLAVFYSEDVRSKKNDLLDALVQLELDQSILDAAEKHAGAVPKVLMLQMERAVQGDRNAINRALNKLKAWDIPQDEIDALHAEATKLCADKNAWAKAAEGRWVNGDKQVAGARPALTRLTTLGAE